MNHHHVHVRAAGAKLHAQVCAGFNHVYLGAYQLGGFTQLVFQALPFIDQHNLVVVQVTAGAQHARQKYHRQRFARALRVPHHTAAVRAGCSTTQAVQNFGRCAVLLVTAHHLDARPAVCVHKHCAGAQYVQQVSWGQHARY